MTIKNIFVTGERGAGKTTLLARWLEHSDIKHTGFVTSPLMIGGVHAGHMMTGLSPLVRAELSIRPISARSFDQNGCISMPEVFNAFGAYYLECAVKDDGQVILMDELGVIERDSKEFIRQVTLALDSDKPVIGAMKLCDAEWLKTIRQRSDTCVIDISCDTREAASIRFSKAASDALICARRIIQ